MKFRGPFRFSKLLAFLAGRNTYPIEEPVLGRVGRVLAVSIPQCYVVAEFKGVPNASGVLGKGLVHCMIKVLEEENFPGADSTHGNQDAKQLRGFCQGKMISFRSGSPVVYEVGKELLAFIGWDGDQHCPSIGNVPKLAAGVAHSVFEKLFRIQLAWVDIWFVVSKDSNKTHDTSLHSPLHLVGASGAVQVVVDMHVISDGW
jgi:hypothetical protein